MIADYRLSLQSLPNLLQRTVTLKEEESSEINPKITNLHKFTENINEARIEHLDIPISLIHFALELDDLNDTGSIKKKKYVFRFDYNEGCNANCVIGYPDAYQVLENNMNHGCNIDDMIFQMKEFMISQINEFLNSDECDVNEANRIKMEGKPFVNNYKAMFKIPRFVQWENFVIIDHTANDRNTPFSSEDLIDLMENYYVPSWVHTRKFPIAELGRHIHIKFQPTEATKVDISRVAFLKVKLHDIHLQRLTPRESIKELVNKKNVGIEQVMDFRIAKNEKINEFNDNEQLFFCVVLMNRSNRNKQQIEFSYNNPVIVDNQNTEITMIIPPLYMDPV